MDRYLSVALAALLTIAAPRIGVVAQLPGPEECVAMRGPTVRQYTMHGVAAFFPVNSTAMEEIVGEYQDTVFGGDDVEMSLTYLPHEGKIAAGLVIAALTTEWTAEYRNTKGGGRGKAQEKRDALYMSAPIGNNGNTRLLNVGELSDSGSVNWNSNLLVDSIDVERAGRNTLVLSYRLDGGVLNFTIVFDPSCANGLVVDGVSITDKVFARFPAVFDWGCDDIGWNSVDYCERLKKDRCSIDRNYGNVCVATTTTSSLSCPVEMTLVGVTGVFREEFPYLAESLPITGFQGEWSLQELDTSVVAPCLC